MALEALTASRGRDRLVATAALLWGFACHRDAPSQVGAARRSSDATAGPPPPSAAVSAPLAPPPKEVIPRFELAGGKPDGTETLWLVVPELGIREAVGESKPPYVCGVAPLAARRASSPWAEGAIATCGPERRTVIWQEGATLSLDPGRSVAIPDTTRLEFEAVSQPAPPELPCGPPPKAATPVAFVRKAIPDGKGMFVRLASSNLELLAAQASRPERCLTTVMPAAERMELICSAGMGFQTALVRRKGDVLFVDLYSEAMEGTESAINSTLGYRLPCGASLSLRGIDFKDPGFVGEMRSPCEARCFDRRSLCKKDCRQRLTRASGELDAEGEACVQGCSDAAERCQYPCPSWHEGKP